MRERSSGSSSLGIGWIDVGRQAGFLLQPVGAGPRRPASRIRRRRRALSRCPSAKRSASVDRRPRAALDLAISRIFQIAPPRQAEPSAQPWSEPLIEYPRHPRALFRIGQFGIAGIDIRRQAALPSAASARVLERRHDEFGIDAEFFRGAFRETLGVFDLRLARPFDLRRSDRNSSRSARRPCASRARTPSAAGFRRDTICPARNAAGRRARSASRNLRIRSSARPRLVGPTAAIFHSGDSRSSTETKVGSPPIVRRTSPAFRSASTCSPSLSRRAQDSSENGRVIRGASRMRLTLISKPNSTSANPTRAADRRRRAIMRRGGDGDMPLAGQHARGDVESDPAGAGQIDLGPGVQIGEIVLDLARSFDRIDVGTQLDEIAGDETGGETEMPEDLDQQPCRSRGTIRRPMPASPPASGCPAPCG